MQICFNLPVSEQILNWETNDQQNTVEVEWVQDHTHGMEGWHMQAKRQPVIHYNKSQQFSELR